MGEVAVKYKIMCDPGIEDVNAEAIASAMQEMNSDVGVVQMVETKPLAFGLKFVEAHCVIQEGDGTVDQFEDAIRSILGVGEVEVLEIGRL
jgi:translation elongation factor aEF-1 beta